jgi:hypothetical protein
MMMMRKKKNNKALVKEMTENADAKAHQHEEPEGTEDPMTKRDSTDEVEPPEIVHRCSLLYPETRSGLDLVDRGAAMAAGLRVPPATGHEGSAKRRRSLPQHPIAKDEPPKKVNKRQEEKCPGLEEEESDRELRLTCAELRCAQYRLKKCLEDEEYTKAAAVNKNAALMSGEPCVEKEEEEEEEKKKKKKKKRQAELRRAQDQLKKCLEDGDYTGAAAVKANISALMSAEPCPQHDYVRSEADRSAATAAGHGSQSATGPVVASAPLARGEAAKGVLTSIEKLAAWKV